MSNPVITRNNVAKTLVEAVFGKKSDNAGKKFFKPEVDLSSPSDVTWLGLTESNSILNKYLTKVFADLFLDHLDEKTGVFNQDAWEADAADFTSGVAKLSDLEEQLDALQAQQQSYALDENFGATDDSGAKTERAVELEELIRTVAAKIKPLRATKLSIEAKYAERAAKRKAKEAASTTKTPAPTTA